MGESNFDYQFKYTGIFSLNYFIQGINQSIFTSVVPIYLFQVLPSVNLPALSFMLSFVLLPFILKFLGPGEKFLRQWKFWDNMITKIFEHTRKKTRKSIEKWETLALIVFVAIPLPVTGAWTGSLAAYLFGLDLKKSLLYKIGLTNEK